MIRRDTTDAEGAAWLLITQPDHAQLAAQCARAWREALVSESALNGELLDAIGLHDDGWREWEARPEIDPEHGRPRSFLEMPLADSLAIWRGSIQAADARGPLAGYTVAGHFCALLRKFHSWQSDWAQRIQAEAFLAEQDALQLSRAERAARGSGEPITPFLERSLRWLQYFDALSLWLCTRERPEPTELRHPDGTIQLQMSAPNEVIATPWPFESVTLKLNVRARHVPARRYASAEELSGGVTPAILDWQLTSRRA